MARSRRFLMWALGLSSVLSVSSAQAVILYSTDVRNTEPPGSLGNRDTDLGPQGTSDPRRLLNSGWQYQASFNGFLATPIASQFIIAARHIGGGVGDTFIYNGTPYTTTAYWDHLSNPNDPNSALSDLRIYKVDNTFSSFAPMYDATVDGSESGKSIVIFGRGTQRGAPVMLSGQLKGWQWGAGDGVQSWGENVVTGFVNYSRANDQRLMYFDFDPNAGPNEGALSTGDSSGGVFINSNGVWKLAAINFGVDGPFSFSSDGSNSFSASLFDASGVYFGNGNDWQLAGNGSIGSSYATRISAELSWINSIIGANAATPVPEPSVLAVGAIAATLTLRRNRRGY